MSKFIGQIMLLGLDMLILTKEPIVELIDGNKIGNIKYSGVYIAIDGIQHYFELDKKNILPLARLGDITKRFASIIYPNTYKDMIIEIFNKYSSNPITDDDYIKIGKSNQPIISEENLNYKVLLNKSLGLPNETPLTQQTLMDFINSRIGLSYMDGDTLVRLTNVMEYALKSVSKYTDKTSEPYILENFNSFEVLVEVDFIYTDVESVEYGYAKFISLTDLLISEMHEATHFTKQESEMKEKIKIALNKLIN